MNITEEQNLKPSEPEWFYTKDGKYRMRVITKTNIFAKKEPFETWVEVEEITKQN